MKEFRVNETNSQIFILSKSSVEERYDPIYYIQKSNLKESKFPLVKIGKSFIIKDGDHDKLPQNEISDKENGFRYLRSQDLKENEIISERPIYISEFYFNKVKRCHIYPKDLLFSIMASVGATAIVPDDFPICTANRAVGILRYKEGGKLTPRYLQAILNTDYGISLLEIRKRGGIQQRLNLTDINNMVIPCPDFDTQEKIILKYEESKLKKANKINEAQSLLDSIDDYLLKELGITLPEQDNSLENRMFITNFSEVRGRRIDSSFHREKYKKLNAEISKSRFDVLYFKSIINKINNGVEIRNYSDEGFRYLRVSDLSQNGIVELNKRIVDVPEIPKRVKLDFSDFLISRSGSLGLVNVVDESVIDSILSSHIFKVNLKLDKINSHYLQAYFRSSLGQWQFFQNNNGGVIPEINQIALKHLKIVVPPINKQEEIASKIQELRSNAKQLQKEAKEEMEVAKKEVEKMILGE